MLQFGTKNSLPGQEVKIIGRREKLGMRGKHNALINIVDRGDRKGVESESTVAYNTASGSPVKPFNYG